MASTTRPATRGQERGASPRQSHRDKAKQSVIGGFRTYSTFALNREDPLWTQGEFWKSGPTGRAREGWEGSGGCDGETSTPQADPEPVCLSSKARVGASSNHRGGALRPFPTGTGEAGKSQQGTSVLVLSHPLGKRLSRTKMVSLP